MSGSVDTVGFVLCRLSMEYCKFYMLRDGFTERGYICISKTCSVIRTSVSYFPNRIKKSNGADGYARASMFDRPALPPVFRQNGTHRIQNIIAKPARYTTKCQQ